jgi:hypothetical protein
MLNLEVNLMRMPKITVPKLYNHSERRAVSHQIASSSGSTSSGRHHATYNTSTFDVPAPDPGDEMDVDLPLHEDDHSMDDMPMPHPGLQEQEQIAELPGLKVHAKQRAKRYNNSVISLLAGCLLYL